jgi:hypothetical protein
MLSRYEGLREWARLQGLDLAPVPAVLAMLDEAIDRHLVEYGGWARAQALALEAASEDPAALDEAIDRFMQEDGRNPRMSAGDVGQFLGTVIVSTADGAYWRLWPNGHPVVRLASGRGLDVIALAGERMRSGQPRLVTVYADAAAAGRT